MQTHNTMRRLSLFGPPVVWAATLFFLSAQPKLPETPGGDKVAHAGAYAVLGVLVARALWGARSGLTTRVLVVASIVITSAYGASDELHQAFVPGRDSSIYDWMADSVGAVLGTLALVVLWTWRRVPRGDQNA